MGDKLTAHHLSHYLGMRFWWYSFGSATRIRYCVFSMGTFVTSLLIRYCGDHLLRRRPPAVARVTHCYGAPYSLLLGPPAVTESETPDVWPLTWHPCCE